jgi:hypothetical protein
MAKFRTLPQLTVLEGKVDKIMTTFKPEHCASNALCMSKDKPCALADVHCCPGCRKPNLRISEPNRYKIGGPDHLPGML